jgi:hypothetical protein
VDRGIFCAALQQRRFLGTEQRHLQGSDDRQRNFVLDVEDVAHLAVISF